MADITRLDPYQCLIRKIGYSVGLESLLERVVSLVDLYSEQRGLSYAAFKDLVENGFQRKNAAEHFAELYGTLNIVTLIGRGIHPLHNLDTLSILRHYLVSRKEDFLSATRIVLLQAVLEADGDIFLNGLASDFEPQRFKVNIIEMIKKKRELIRNVIKSPGALKKVDSIIDIKSQPSQKGEQSPDAERQRGSKFIKRTISLGSLKRTTSLSGSSNGEIDVPDDYLRKVPTTRKNWAEDFALFENGQKSTKGSKLLETLDNQFHVKQETGCYIMWPYSKDLARLQIQPKDIRAPEMNPWLLLCTIATGTNDIKVDTFDEKRDYSEIISLLKEFHALFREGNLTLGSIRHQLPLYVAEPCIVALRAAGGKNIPPLPAIIAAEAKKPYRKVISGTDGSLAFSEEK